MITFRKVFAKIRHYFSKDYRANTDWGHTEDGESYVVSGTKRTSHPAIWFTEQYCPECSARMDIISAQKDVPADSPEAADYDFSSFREYGTIGRYRFIEEELKCPKCGLQVSIERYRMLKRNKHS